ncbi:MAG TPA: zinc metallopeptidase [Planctomycetota bacterium]|nr:zinc metallopeptidase [Planctomycetota bacterium]
MFFDPLWFVFGIPAALFALWAQMRVKHAFTKYSQVTLRRPISGADVAWAIVRSSGLEGVKVEPIHGHLTDHYDPRSRTLRLSEPVYESRSVAAVGVAAHEAGHSLQHAKGYAPLQLRSAWVPLASFGSNLSWLVLMAGVLLASIGGRGDRGQLGHMVIWAGIGLFAFVVAFTLITLPVEFDASRRAVALLSQKGIVTAEEEKGVREVLNAAALTYVAAAASAILQLIYLIVRFGGAGRRDE